MKYLSLAFVVLSINTYAQHPSDAEAHNKLALKLLAATHKDGENIMLSPFNIYFNLALIAAGSAGSTEKELIQVLNSSNPAQTIVAIQNGLKSAMDHQVVSIANSFWMNGNTRLQAGYADRFKNEFHGQEFKVTALGSRESVGKINQWVATQTDNMIKEAVTMNDMANSFAALINTILFKGSWTMPFDATKTRTETFYTYSGKLSSAMFMNRKGPVNSYRNEWLVCYELFFHDSLSFVIAMGAEDISINKVLAQMEYDPSSITGLVTKGDHYDFYMPKFKFSHKTELIPVLQKIGLNDLFTPGADLSKMFVGSGIRVDKIVHSTAIDVGEKGVEAAAATAAIFSRSMPPTIKINKPFIFFILSKPSNAIIFEGVLEDPQK